MIHTHDRRSFLHTVCAAGMWAALPAGRAAGTQRGAYSDKAVTDAWITGWMAQPHAASGALHLGRFADQMYFLNKPISWSPDTGQGSFPSVVVPTGFVTDFASIPQVFWSMLPKDGLYTYAAIIHDYLYWTQPMTDRKVADDIFKLVMKEFKVPGKTVAAVYYAVRAGGGPAWHHNALLAQRGEKRILRRYPDDPKIRWEEWKLLDDVWA